MAGVEIAPTPTIFVFPRLKSSVSGVPHFLGWFSVKQYLGAPHFFSTVFGSETYTSPSSAPTHHIFPILLHRSSEKTTSTMAPGDHKQHKRTPEIVAFLDQFHAHGAKADYDAYTKCLHPDGVWCGPEREAIYTVAELKTLLKSDLWKDGVKPPILPKEGDSSPSRNSLATEEHKKNYAWNWVCRTRKVDVVEGFFDGAVADVVVAHVDEILEDQNLEDVEKMGCMLRGSAVLVSEAVGTGWRLLR